MRTHLIAALAATTLFAVAGCATTAETTASTGTLDVTFELIERQALADDADTEGCLFRVEVTNASDEEIGGHIGRSAYLVGPSSEEIRISDSRYFDGQERWQPNEVPAIEIDGALDWTMVPQVLAPGETFAGLQVYRCTDLEGSLITIDDQTFPSEL